MCKFFFFLQWINLCHVFLSVCMSISRRAHLKDCFENLRNTVPNMEDKKAKTSNLSILRGALRFIQVYSLLARLILVAHLSYRGSCNIHCIPVYICSLSLSYISHSVRLRFDPIKSLRIICHRESFSGLLSPPSLSHGAPASLLYIYITMQADTYKQHIYNVISIFLSFCLKQLCVDLRLPPPLIRDPHFGLISSVLTRPIHDMFHASGLDTQRARA